MDAFANWAMVVVAGDWHAAGGAPTLGFDNARREVTAAFERAGFSASHTSELSVRPDLYPKEPLLLSNVADVGAELRRTAADGPDGCLFYLTTHGSPFGTPVGVNLMTPHVASRLLDQACGERPTVVIISACFSGIFIPKLAAPNRMVLTAARPDRTSFGCGQSDRYPFFDDCILRTLPEAHDFLMLADRTRACIAAREKAERMRPPSEPQLSVGSAIEPLLKMLAFVKPPPGAARKISAAKRQGAH